MSDQPVVAAKAPIRIAVEAGKDYWWCACGKSAKQPFCDGSHKGGSFSPMKYTADKTGDAWFCACKGTGKTPLCDGTHNKYQTMGTVLEYAALTAPALREMAARDAIVIVPVGATEQHGPHLPVMVDHRMATEVAMQGAARLHAAGHPVLVTPTVWMGFSEHHMELGGTITVDQATFQALLSAIVRSLVRGGFRRICLLNGHGGNIAPLTVIASELTVELRVPLVTFSYYQTDPAATRAILEHQDAVLHACEAETSMLMAVEPHLVDMARLNEAHGPDQDRPEIEALVGPAVFRWQALNARARSGVVGNGAAGTPDKGRRLIEAYVARLAEILGSKALWEARASDLW